jgi:hypothetical protein
VRNGLPFNFTQAKAGNAIPPDPLGTLDGKRITRASQWTDRRRDKVLNLLRDNQYGRPPPPHGKPHEGKILTRDDGRRRGGLARREQIAIMSGLARSTWCSTCRRKRTALCPSF